MQANSPLALDSFGLIGQIRRRQINVAEVSQLVPTTPASRSK
jgi:hypothetical protein